jgi:simple sugar transport system permease protein
LLGALAGYLATLATGSPWLGLLAAIAAGIVSNVFLAWMYVIVQASQVVVGIVFNGLALGVASYGYQLAVGEASNPQLIPMLAGIAIPVLSEIPILGPAFFAQTGLLYLTVVMTIVADIVLRRTRFGLAVRAVGENPRAADTAGIRVQAIRFVGVLISGAGAGAAGGYLVLAQIGLFRDTIVTGQGFIALAIVIFGRWRPFYAMLAALTFGAADALQLSLQLFAVGVPAQLLLALPYLLTIVAVSGLVGRAAQPTALMLPYRKE